MAPLQPTAPCSTRPHPSRNSHRPTPLHPPQRCSSKLTAQAALHDEGAAISVRGVKLSFRGRQGAAKQVLNGVDLSVPRGTLHMLLGANGCGKSTLLRALAGLLHPEAGSLTLDKPHAMVFQNPDNQVVLPTVGADVAFGLGRYRLTPAQVDAAVGHALERVGLAGCGERPTSSLSGGQKQRVAIAGALAENPRVLLLDELTTFLDWEDQRRVLRCVRHIVDTLRRPSYGHDSGSRTTEHSENGNSSGGSGGGSSSGDDLGAAGRGQPRLAALDNPVTALWVTHRLEELEFADGVSLMEEGRVVFTGPPQEARQVMRRLGAVV